MGEQPPGGGKPPSRLRRYFMPAVLSAALVGGTYTYFNDDAPGRFDDNYGPAEQDVEPVDIAADGVKEIPYSKFMEDVGYGLVDKAATQTVLETGKEKLWLVYRNGDRAWSRVPENENVAEFLQGKNVELRDLPPERPSIWPSILIGSLPFLLVLGLGYVAIRSMKNMQMGPGGPGGNNGGGTFGRRQQNTGKSKARLIPPGEVMTRFEDVAGADEAKEDVQEVVEFLKNPAKFQRLGANIPRGVLMEGEPGTGKTLLAKAVAGEAGVSFLSISGSDFVEMFVGVGASRVRELFAEARQHSPSIIFIDEIDAVGRRRGGGNSSGGGHDEREQTLNQILVEMDGMDSGPPVIVIAATNRADVLDPALIRPGRFDRRVNVGLPDINGREKILEVHMQGKPFSEGVDRRILARGTPGMSGADLANLVNEAALFAARQNKKTIDMDDFEKAKDKIIMGAERKSMAMSEKEKRNTAYHEAGHAVLQILLPHADPLYKVTIIPRGRALGVTMSLPEQDRYSMTKNQLLAQMTLLFGGRIAEKEIAADGGDFSTGASNDLERATQIAEMIVTKGMDDELGPIDLGGRQNSYGITENSHSEHMRQKIDKAKRRYIDDHYKQAEKILKDNWDGLVRIAEGLMKYETISGAEAMTLLTGGEIERVPGEKPDIEEPPEDQSSGPPDQTQPGMPPPMPSERSSFTRTF